MDERTWVLRTILRDEPGALGRVATALGALGVDIRTIHVHHDAEGRAVDELTVAVPGGRSSAELSAAVRDAGALEVEVAVDGRNDPEDATAIGLRLAANLVRSGMLEEMLAHAVRTLTGADDAWVVPLPEEPPTELLAESGRQRIPVSEQAASVRAGPPGEGRPWVLSVPSAPTSPLPRLAVALRGSAAFADAEIERVGALLTLVDACEAIVPRQAGADEVPAPAPAPRAPDDRAARTVVLRDGAPATVRPVRGDDALGILRMHARCSDETLRRRFFSALPSMPMRKLRWFTRSDPRDHVGLVAARDGDIVGIAQLVAVPEGDGAELGMLVEDAVHRRGVGRALLDALLDEALRLGYSTVVAELLPGNVPMARLLATCGLPTELEHRDGGVHATIDLDAARTEMLAGRRRIG